MIRESLENEEYSRLSPFAVYSAKSAGRVRNEPECQFRTCFMRDVDRITYSKAFRRLKHKTQVFLEPEGDHYRTRLTHTLEVARIARTLARVLRLNEDLTEAIALGHDLGHTPFGHAGEKALDKLTPGGFKHNVQSVRVTDILEKNGWGLNLTSEVRDGILNHCGGPNASTLEGKTVHFADRIAYINHDIDDAIRAGVLDEREIPRDIAERLGSTHKARINTLVSEIVRGSEGKNNVEMPEDALSAMLRLREFLFLRVYDNPVAKSEESKVIILLGELYYYYEKHLEELPREFLCRAEYDGIGRVISDYLAGMTDRYAVARFSELFIPNGWTGVK